MYLKIKSIGYIKGIRNLDLTPCNLHIDNWLFKLYKLTGIAFVFLSILVSARLYTGHPMVCTETKELPEDLINAYCWMNSTFTVRLDKDGHTGNRRLTTVGTEFYTTGSDKQKYYKYYQWLSFVLLLQSSLCYLPVYLWGSLERGKLELLLLGLESDAIPECVKSARKTNLVLYLKKNLHTHKMYALSFLCCELVVLVLIGIQKSFMDYLFEEDLFVFYYTAIFDLIMGNKTQNDTLSQLFPKLTKCTFRMHGPTGELQLFDSLCLLPVNIVAEKVFTAVWFWLNILYVASIIWLTGRLLSTWFSTIRVYILMSLCRNIPQSKIRKLTLTLDFGDFFILNLILRKIDESIRMELVSELCETLM